MYREMRKLHSNFYIRYKRKGVVKVIRQNRAHHLPSLDKFICNLFLWHGDDSLLKILELYSKNDCEEQDRHEDSPDMERDRATKNWTRNWQDLQYSILISIWPGTVWVNDKGETIEIPVGSFMVWRGDYSHNGGAYKNEHKRLFICIGSERYPPSDFVAYEKENPPSVSLPTVASGRYPKRQRTQL
jgi:hypothetical protein